ncbi:MAG: AEC family transporter [bacterium]
MGLIQILNVILPIFLLICIGFLLGYRGFLKEEVNTVFSRLIFYVCVPALLFRSAALTDLSEAVNGTAICLLVGATVLISGAGYLFAFSSSPERRGVIAQGAHRSNLVFIGIPVITAALGSGESVMGTTALLIGILAPLYNFLAVVELTLPYSEGRSNSDLMARTAREVMLNPLILACAAGFLVSGLGITLPEVADKTLELLGSIAPPLALLVVGASMKFQGIKDHLAAGLAVSAGKLLVYPALVYFLFAYFGVEGTYLKVALLLVATPTAVISHIFAREMKGDEQLAASIIILSTVLSMVTISGWLAFLG